MSNNLNLFFSSHRKRKYIIEFLTCNLENRNKNGNKDGKPFNKNNLLCFHFINSRKNFPLGHLKEKNCRINLNNPDGLYMNEFRATSLSI